MNKLIGETGHRPMAMRRNGKQLGNTGTHPVILAEGWQVARPALASIAALMTAHGASLLETDSAYISRERDFYLELLELSLHKDPHPLLKTALELVVGLVDATQGYLEFFDRDTGHQNLWYSFGFPDDDVSSVRNLVSHGIIAEAVATERMVVTSSALLDPRFRDRASVRQSGIHAVICVPIGSDPPRGVLYLQNAVAGRDVMAERCLYVERFAKYLAPIADHVVQVQGRVVDKELAHLQQKLHADDVLGTGPAMRRLLQEVQAVAALDVSVLLSGETGTGKSQLARLIHQNSGRAGGPFLEVNCATLQDQLFENELFGAVSGAHSTATKRTEGKVAAAEGGTLFFDEVAELSLTAQAKLLQLLQSKEYFPLGASRPMKANARVLAASNIDLGQAVAAKRFRQDLFYRLQVVSIRLPSLSERTEDVPLLARHFCESACNRHGLPNLSLSTTALRSLEATVWPGNVRELANCVEAAAIRAAGEGANQISVAHLFRRSVTPSGPTTLTFQEETRRFQSEVLQRALAACDWNISATARQLDLTRAHVYNLIKSFGLER
jgi:Nif-specific regulatory protein